MNTSYSVPYISKRYEHLLKGVTVRIVVDFVSEENTPISGTGFIYTNDISDVGLIFTAKHCLLGDDLKREIQDIKSIKVQYKYYNEDLLKEIRVSTSKIIIREGDEPPDIALLIVERKILLELTDLEEIPQFKFTDHIRNSYYTNGYPKAFEKSAANTQEPQYHFFESIFLSEQKTCFEVNATQNISPGTGDQAIEAIKGYSGSGLFIRNIDYLSGLIVRLKSATGNFDTFISLKIENANSILEGNTFNIPKLKIVSLPEFLKTNYESLEKFKIDISSFGDNTYVTKEFLLKSDQDRSNLPPFSEKFSKRVKLVNN